MNKNSKEIIKAKLEIGKQQVRLEVVSKIAKPKFKDVKKKLKIKKRIEKLINEHAEYLI